MSNIDLSTVSDDDLDVEVARRSIPNVNTLTLFQFPHGTQVVGYNQEHLSSQHLLRLHTLYVSIRNNEIYITPHKKDHHK